VPFDRQRIAIENDTSHSPSFFVVLLYATGSFPSPLDFSHISLFLRILSTSYYQMLRSSLSRAASRATGLSTNSHGALRFMSAKEIKFGVDGRTAMLKGVETLADAVQVCLPF
jgi:hypothetical protein